MPQSFANVLVHLVFSTRGREHWITTDITPRLFPFIGGIIRERNCTLLEIGGFTDHLHLLISLGREISISAIVRDVKSKSSKWIHDEFPTLAHCSWQNGYGIFSVSQSNIETVRQYIQKQELHHRQLSFQDEYRELLRRHGIGWDERFIWE